MELQIFGISESETGYRQIVAKQVRRIKSDKHEINSSIVFATSD